MKKVYIKEEVCIGCHLCEVYCQLQHAHSKDIIKAFKRESPRPLPRLRVEEKGEVSFSVRCSIVMKLHVFMPAYWRYYP